MGIKKNKIQIVWIVLLLLIFEGSNKLPPNKTLHFMLCSIWDPNQWILKTSWVHQKNKASVSNHYNRLFIPASRNSVRTFLQTIFRFIQPSGSVTQKRKQLKWLLAPDNHCWGQEHQCRCTWIIPLQYGIDWMQII